MFIRLGFCLQHALVTRVLMYFSILVVLMFAFFIYVLKFFILFNSLCLGTGSIIAFVLHFVIDRLLRKNIVQT